MNKLIAFMGLAIALSASTLQAAFQVTVSSGSYSSGNGGEFTAVPDASLSWVLPLYSSDAKQTVNGKVGFQTFCIDLAHTFSPGATYNYQIGGSVTIGTAWLYSQFAAGTLSGYNYDHHRKDTAGELQDAFWYLDQGRSYSGHNKFIDLVQSELASSHLPAGFTNIKDPSLGQYGVTKLQLFDNAGNLAQFQLVAVPEPSTYIAGLSAFGMLCLLGRRNRK